MCYIILHYMISYVIILYYVVLYYSILYIAVQAFWREAEAAEVRDLANGLVRRWRATYRSLNITNNIANKPL